MRVLTALTCLLLAAGCNIRQNQPQSEPADAAPEAKVDRASRLMPEPYTGPDEARRLIEKLQELEGPFPGLESHAGSVGFAPLGYARQAGPLVLGGMQYAANEAVTRLLELGPEAVPALLDHLDDARPTRYLAGGGVIMWMMRRPALDFPREATSEAEFVRAAYEDGKWDERRLSFELDVPTEQVGGRSYYRVTVGDACFTILGQITNRYYAATRYQPTGGMVVCSPVLESKLAAAVRKIWTGPDLAARLKSNWLAELDLSDGTRYHIGAAIRLLYYFGEAHAADVVRRINADQEHYDSYAARLCEAVALTNSPVVLDHLLSLFRATKEFSLALVCFPAVMKRDPALAAALLDSLDSRDIDSAGAEGVAVRMERRSLVRACMGAMQPEIRAALARLIRHARDEMEFVACADAAAVLAREDLAAAARSFLSRDELKDPRPMSAVLSEILRLLQRECVEMVDSFVKSGDAGCLASLALAVGVQDHPQWRGWIRPMLLNPTNSGYGSREVEHRRQNGWSYYSESIRVCDLAAWAAAQRDSTLTFAMEGSHEDLDRQIAAIYASMKD